MKHLFLVIIIIVMSLSQATSQQPNTCDPCPPGGGCTLWVVQPPITQGIDGCDVVIKWMLRTCTCNGVTRDELQITEITVTTAHCDKTELQMEALFKDAVSEVIYYYSMVKYGADTLIRNYEIIFRNPRCWKYIYEEVWQPRHKKLARSMVPCWAATHYILCCEWIMSLTYNPWFQPNVILNSIVNTPTPPQYDFDCTTLPDPWGCINYCENYPPPGPMPLPFILSVENTESSISYSLTPSIASNRIDVALEGEINGTVGLNIFNITGQQVIQRMFNKTQTRQTFNMDVSNLSAGLYNIVMILPNGIVVNGVILVNK